MTDELTSAEAPAEGKVKPTVSRRGMVIGGAGALAVVALGGLKYVPSAALVRPPGAQDEDELLSGCIHCLRCMEACPQHAINISHLEDGILQMRTPKMDFKKGWCNFCEDVDGGPRCAAVCPTGCIQKLTTPTTIIGLAKITDDWCLAYRGMGCHSCVDACNYEAMYVDESNHEVYVIEDMCNGCGACENACISLTAGSLSGTWEKEAPTDRAITVKTLA